MELPLSTRFETNKTDESEFWLELIIEASLMKRERVEPLLKEAVELTVIFARSIYTARKSK